MLKDRDGIIWLGTYKSGISYFHPDIFRFQMFKYQRSKAGSLPARDINALAGDAKGNLWIGSNGGGLIYFDRAKSSYRQYLHDPADPHSLSNNVVVSLLPDHESILWIGTYYGGLNRFDGHRFVKFMHDPANPKTPGDDNAWTILEDSQRNLWTGTLKAGVDVYDRKRNEFYHYKNGEANSIHTSYVPALMEDREGNIWMGTGYGVEVLNRQSGRFAHYLNAAKDSTSVSDNGTTSILQDHRGLIWVGTRSGLNLFEPAAQKFRVFREEQGLSGNYILSLIEDNEHNIWIATPQGLSKLVVSALNEPTASSSNQKSAPVAVSGAQYAFSFTNYGESDGLWGSAFHENAATKLSTGELAFGGLQGFIIFNPNSISENKNASSVVFTELQLFNRDIKVGERKNDDVVLPSALAYLDEITLKPSNNIFSIGFTALNFFHPGKTKYKYKLEGFNKDWLTTERMQRSVTFTNLDPGEYTLQVLASNSDGSWSSDPTSIRIKVLPPFWKSNTALLIYFLLILGTLLLIRWITLSRIRLNFKTHHEKLEAQRMHELDTMKIKFFTNVSHEFRTPLTLIITPLEKLLAKASGDDVNQLQLINRNARRLLNLVNQLLDFRKLEVQEVRLNPSEGDIVGFIKYLVYSFSDLSEKKNIHLSFNTTVPHLETFFDQDKVEKILFNLLSNAFKFTPQGGSVRVELSLKEKESNNFLLVKVIDSGIGIPADKIHRIFERFYQNDLPGHLVNQGSGIGLSITAEFVKVHGGSIEVESEPGNGSCFTVSLPVTPLESETVMHHVQTEDDQRELMVSNSDGKPVILLIEDHEDFRSYLRDSLSTQYCVLEAANGKAGVQIAKSVVPDLIVSDIMMPEMSGDELCRKIRSDVLTSHIPIILLTARAAEEQKIEGFEAGANDYITKPFSFEILLSRIRNLLAQREASQKQFQKHFDVKASNIEVASLDEKLIRRAIEVVEQNIMEADFSIENFSQELGMSRVYLYKKLVSLTGKSPLDFVKTIRLQRAAQLLEKSDLNVSEVAYRVGFNNPKYFAKCFKEEYKVLPSAYAASRKQADIQGRQQN